MKLFKNRAIQTALGIVGFLFVITLFYGDNIEQPPSEDPVNDIIEVGVLEKLETTLYVVTSVVDGDTIKVSIDGKIETIRLIGIDTPETVHPTKPVECFGLEASKKAKELLTNQKVSIETDSTQGTYDKYDRLLAYVLLEDGTNFNKLMISEGYGYEYTYNLPYKYQSDFKLAQEEAQVNKRGLWADGVCEEDVAEETIDVSALKLRDVTSNPSSYTCSYNAYNCGDFSTHDEAQSVYLSCGGVSNDIHALDRDKDGLACETLP